MAREMLINVSEGEECRIALLENGKLDEFYIERTSATSHVGNIYRGRVVNVEASIQAAFIDFGLGRNGFLHISDLQPSYFGRSGEDVTESVGRKLARRDRPPIQRCLRRGDEIVVQIIKEGIGTKGPTLTTYLSIPGRILVMMPGMAKMGVSRKIEDEVERRRLRQILDSLDPIEDCGFIIRTAGVGKTKAEIQRDLAYLTRLWQQITKKMQSASGPMSLYTEGDLVTRTVRDLFSTEIDALIVDNEKVAEQLRDYIKLTSPRTKDKIELYDGPLPLFDKYNIEREIEMMYSRHVPLPSGGSLVIDQTEAVVTIDVNSGKFRDHSDAETTAFKTDMEAAEEIPRQLKLRDLGGVIICDFIDLRFDRHRRELEQRLHDNFKNDRAKTKVLRMSQFGIIELTRQRMRPSVKRSIYCDCAHCHGSGLVKTPESMSLDVMRKLAIATHDQRVVRIQITVHTEVATFLNNRKRRQIAELEAETGRQIIILTDMGMGLDEVRFALFDARDGIVVLQDLLSHAPQTIQEAQLMAIQARQNGGERRDRRGGRRDRFERRGGGGGRRHHDEAEEQEERYEYEEIEARSEEHGDREEEPREHEEIGEAEEQHELLEVGASDDVAFDEEVVSEEAGEEVSEEAYAGLGAGDEEDYDQKAHAEQGSFDEETESEPREQHRREDRREGGRDDRGGRFSREQRERRDDRGRDQREGGSRRQEQPRGQQPQRQDQRQGQGQPPRRPQQQPEQQPYAAFRDEQGGDDSRGGRRRGRRGRGRGRFGDQQPQQRPEQLPPTPGLAPARSQDELLRRMPTNIWIQMPGDDEIRAMMEPEVPPIEQPSESYEEVAEEPQARIQEPEVVQAPRAAEKPRPAPVQAKPAAEVRMAPIQASEPEKPVIVLSAKPVVPSAPVAKPKSVFVEPAGEVKPAPIAEWVEESPLFRRRKVAAAVAEETVVEEEAKPAKGKRGTTRKTAAAKTPAKAAKATKATAAKTSRSRKKVTEDETPAVAKAVFIDEEPGRVRIAEDNSTTKDGDRHLATDEPVDPEAVRKVNAPRDLDHVPEEE